MDKKLNWINIIKYAGAYIAFIIGSGFATGQEIIQFFTSQGVFSLGAILISMVLYAWVGGAMTDIGFHHREQAKANAYSIVCGKWLGTFYEYFVRVFLFAVVVVMISGAGATLNEYYGMNYYVGSLFMALLIFLAFACGFSKLIDIIGCIGPVIIVFSIIVAIGSIASDGNLQLATDVSQLADMQASPYWWVSGMLYAAYNIFGAVPFLMTMGAEAGSGREVRIGGFLGGIVLMGAVLFMNMALILRTELAATYAVPTLQLAKDLSPVLGAVFSVILLCGIFSTAAPMMWTVCSKLAGVGTKKSLIVAAVLTAIAFGLGQLPFGTLVGIIYPYTGYLGILLLACLAVYRVKAVRKKGLSVKTDCREENVQCLEATKSETY